MTFHTLARPVAAPRAAGGPYGWLTPYVAAIAAHNPDVAARALMLSRAELHFIALALSLMGERRDDADHLGAFARALGRTPRRSTLADFAPGADPRLAGLTGRLAGRPWRAPAYLRLAALWAEPHARKTLLHLRRITRRHTLTLARLPAPYRTPGVLRMASRSRALAEIVFAIDVVRRIRTDLTDRQILASLEKAETAHIRDWMLKHYERVPFPPPPTGALHIDGVDAIRPLTSYADLERAAREFNNCIADYLWRIQKGDAYFYRYAPAPGGAGVAVVEVKRAPVIGWVVNEALGPGNAPVSGADRAAILAAFRAAGVPAAPQAVHPNAWISLD